MRSVTKKEEPAPIFLVNNLAHLVTACQQRPITVTAAVLLSC